jgi:hypothetical protein
MKFLYYLAAFGNNDIPVKYDILIHNLNYIYNNIKEKFSIVINFYTISNEIKDNIRKLDFIENTYFYEKTGILTELFLTNPYNNEIHNYDYILFTLDDVKIINIDILNMIEIKKKYKIQILSPKILNSTHPFMNVFNNLTIHNFLEVYMLLLSPLDFDTFCSIHTIENKWMWGVDLLFGYYNIKAGVINSYVVNHVFPSKTYRTDAANMCNEYMRKYTKYTNYEQIPKDYYAISQKIDNYI